MATDAMDGAVTAGETVALTLFFSLPASVGNEAQAAALSFRLAFRLEAE